MALITMTEGLAELKTLLKRIAKKREQLMPYLWRQEGLKDPMQKEEGGSVGHVQRERQAIRDLEDRFVTIRTEIQRANQTTTITIQDETHTMSHWLNWRKEIAQGQAKFVNEMRSAILTARRNAQSRGSQVLAAGQDTSNPLDVLVNVDEQELLKEAERYETILGELDGKLSLKLATTTIDV